MQGLHLREKYFRRAHIRNVAVLSDPATGEKCVAIHDNGPNENMKKSVVKLGKTNSQELYEEKHCPSVAEACCRNYWQKSYIPCCRCESDVKQKM